MLKSDPTVHKIIIINKACRKDDVRQQLYSWEVCVGLTSEGLHTAEKRIYYCLDSFAVLCCHWQRSCKICLHRTSLSWCWTEAFIPELSALGITEERQFLHQQLYVSEHKATTQALYCAQSDLSLLLNAVVYFSFSDLSHNWMLIPFCLYSSINLIFPLLCRSTWWVFWLYLLHFP